MEYLTGILTVIGVLSSLKQGIAAGAVLSVVAYFREKKKIEDRVRFMRALSLIMESQYEQLETHNRMHPEAMHDTNRYVRRIIEIGIPVPLWNPNQERR